MFNLECVRQGGENVEVNGFFSYAHVDDIHSCLTNLKCDLCDEFQQITGSKLSLFFNRDSLAWGGKWRESISSGINGSLIFIPVLSPNYLNSGSCVQELKQYLAKVNSEGARELILPILLSDVKNGSLGLDLDDSLVDEVLKYQYRDMRQLRFYDRGTGVYNKLVNDAARELALANQRLNERAQTELENDTRETTNSNGKDVEDTADGNQPHSGDEENPHLLLDDLGMAEGLLKDMTGDLESISQTIQEIGSITEGHAENLNMKSELTPRELLCRTAELAKDLQPWADKYARQSGTYLTHTNSADSVISGLLPFWNNSKEQRVDLNMLLKNARSAKGQMLDLKSALDNAERLSRVLYKPLSSIKRSTSICLAAIDITIGWGDGLDVEVTEGQGEVDQAD